MIGLKGFSILMYSIDKVKPKAITYFICSSGSLIAAAFSSIIGENAKLLASASRLLYMLNTSTGRLMLRMPFPLIRFLPILLRMYEKTFRCSAIFC